jgi:type IV secretion system protein VirB10
MQRTFETTALLSLIGAGLQLSQPRGAITANGYYPSAGEVAAAAVGQQLAEVAQQLLRRDLDVRPTMHIRQGLQFNVFLNTDLVFAEPYDERQ